MTTVITRAANRIKVPANELSRAAVRRVIEPQDLLRADFWRSVSRSIWLFFPAVIALTFAWFCFWKLSQGRDVMIVTLENRKVFGLFLLGLVFWMMITWYTSRLVAKAKNVMTPDTNALWTTLRIQGPRMLAFTCVTLVILGFFQLSYPKIPQLPAWLCHLLFWASFPYYFLLYSLVNRALNIKAKRTVREKILIWQRLRLAAYMSLVVLTLTVVLTHWFSGLIILLLIYQAGFIMIILVRRNIIDIKNDYSFQKNDATAADYRKLGLWKKIVLLVTDKEDFRYFQSLNVVSFFAAIIYFATIFSVSFSVQIGSFPFLFLALGVLLGLGNFIAMISVLTRFNFHLALVILAFVVGQISEPHYSRLEKKNVQAARFDERQSLREFFVRWISDSSRAAFIRDSANADNRYPIYFAMANGGASRSGYWAASVLSMMQDQTQGKFSNHLFCLSGASGGSVGNAAFFSLLRAKDRLQNAGFGDSAFLKASKQYLRSDFLTFTLARTLGPDIFRNFITLYRVHDRASALSFALEKAAGKNTFLQDSLGVQFSQIATRRGQQYQLPILFINTTRMQDGGPGVISNIKIDDSVFNQRIDVLSLLGEKRDMRLSTAVVLGASFPYLSPAGRIDHKPCDTCKTTPNYFVDGGYFDNSGSGAVFEIIFGIRQLLNTPEFAAYKDKFDFQVLHITNDPQSATELTRVNPFTNDLAAPIKTLLGAYGTQTSVNDYRLRKYLADLYGEKTDKGTHYKQLSLYRVKDSLNYTMSWVISGHVLNAMNHRLGQSPELKNIIAEMKTRLR